MLTKDDFTRINFFVWNHDIDGGFFKGGTSVTIKLQNSCKLFIDKGDDKQEWSISTFDEGIKIANEHL